MSRSTPPAATLVSPAQVQKLETHIAILIHYIHQWMQKSIAEVEDRIKKQVAKSVEQQIQVVHKCLDAFELRVLSRQTPTTNLNTIQADFAILQANIGASLDIRGIEKESAPTDLAKDTVLEALFKVLVNPQSEQ